jgi:sulfite reductase (NADPH) hemoprotein beta-component
MTAISAPSARQKLEPRHAMLLRCRLPGGVITTKQWQAIDKFAAENTIYGSIRLTNRQTFQFHGILKKNVAGAPDAALGRAGRAGHRQR